MNSTASNRSLLHRLYGFLEDWKELTIEEGRYIKTENWEALESVQSKKGYLQPLIEDAETSVFGGNTLSAETKAAEKDRLRRFASDLLRLEEKNRELLTDRMATTDQQLKASDKTIRCLRQVHRVYGSSNRPLWQTYS